MSVDYEVASEILSGENGFLIQALRAEKNKPNPSQLLIRYYEARIAAVVDLKYDFTSADPEVTSSIIDLKPIFGCRGNVQL